MGIGIFGPSPLVKFIFVAALLLNFGIFRWYSTYEGNRAVTMIETILRDEYKSASTFQLARSLTDLEHLRYVRCVQLVEQSTEMRVFYDTSEKPGCRNYSVLSSGFSHHADLIAANGVQYHLIFRLPANWQALLLELFGYVFSFGVAGSYLRDQKHREVKQGLIAKSSAELFGQAQQVAHDIRSPLSALEAVMKHADMLPLDQRELVRSATIRIRDIANDLLNYRMNVSLPSTPSLHELGELLVPIIVEKKVLFSVKSQIWLEFNFATEFGSIKVCVSPLEFGRVLSNLLNNAVESMQEGTIHVEVKEISDRIQISVRDTGKGIPPEVLKKLGAEKISYGKTGQESGSGLGVYHAKKSVESWGGTFVIESELNRGTTVTMSLPKAQRPAGTRPVILLDDDSAMHTLWKISARKAGVSLECVATSEELEARLQKLPDDADIYLDENLGKDLPSGVDVAKSLYDRGFRNLFLSTGSPPEKFQHATWFKAIGGKAPPWT